VTYPTQAVADTIDDNFVPVQVNTQDGSGASLVERYRQVWTPDLRVLDTDGFELYRWNGYLPPYEYLPQLLVGLGQAYLRKHDEARAAATFEQVIREYPTSAAAPEAEYYYAVSMYKHSHQPDDLMGNWDRLRRDHPESTWRVRQSFSENAS
jgi:tetratricopeptide (TPR) repeat protein